MQKVFFALVLLISQLTISAQKNSIDILHYQFNIEVTDNNDSVHGQAGIQIKFNEQVSSFTLNLSSVNEKGKGMRVFSVTGSAVRNYKQEAEHLIVYLTGGAKQNDTGNFVIQYAGIPADGLIISENKFGHRTFFSDNWPDRAHYWLPCVDHPADKASVEFIVTAPDHYQVVSNGIQVEETNLPGSKKLTYWKEDVPLSTKVMAIGVAEFAVQYAGDAAGIPIYSWVYPQNRKEGFDDYEQTKDILPFFINYIGPYAYKKLANVQSKTMFGGMENAGAIFYSENSVTGTKRIEELMAHEIAHQWFGDMASETNFSHLWLSEGFATYFANLYMENKYGKTKMNEMLQQQRKEVIEFSKVNHSPVVDSNSDYMELLNANSYQKGGWVLHMLRIELGDNIFHKIIRAYYERFAGKNADTEDFRKVAEEVSGKNLQQFFKQWLYTPGQPQLLITWKKNLKEKMVEIKIEQKQKNIFTVPLEFGLVSGNKTGDKKILMVSKQKETFKLAYDTDFDSIIFDPNTVLLFEKTVRELK